MGYDLITVNAGHSHYSTGASGNGFKEHEVARQIKNKLLQVFKAVGQKTADTTSDGESKSAVLQEQVFKCNLYKNLNQLDVSIHLNAGGGTGVEILYYSEKQLAADLSKRISTALTIRDRGAKQRTDLYFLKNTNAPAILIEVCFIDSADDMQRLMMYMDRMVLAIVAHLTGKQPSMKTHTVASGDTLYAISKKYHVSVVEIKALNPTIKPDNIISIGQVIKLP